MERLRGVKKGVLSAGHLYHPFQGKYPQVSDIQEEILMNKTAILEKMLVVLIKTSF